MPFDIQYSCPYDCHSPSTALHSFTFDRKIEVLPRRNGHSFFTQRIQQAKMSLSLNLLPNKILPKSSFYMKFVQLQFTVQLERGKFTRILHISVLPQEKLCIRNKAPVPREVCACYPPIPLLPSTDSEKPLELRWPLSSFTHQSRPPVNAGNSTALPHPVPAAGVTCQARPNKINSTAVSGFDRRSGRGLSCDVIIS